MSDFFHKLNVLVRAGMQDILGEPQRRLNPKKLGPNLDAEVRLLRERVNQALDYEDELVARVQHLRAEAERLNTAADAAVMQQRDDTARRLVEDWQRAQQRLQIAESDLQAHRIVTQELITRVNELDAAVADARHNQRQVAASDEESATVTPGPDVSDMLREMQAKIASLGQVITAGVAQAGAAEAEVTDGEVEAAIEDDLEARRNRLRKK